MRINLTQFLNFRGGHDRQQALLRFEQSAIALARDSATIAPPFPSTSGTFQGGGGGVVVSEAEVLEQRKQPPIYRCQESTGEVHNDFRGVGRVVVFDLNERAETRNAHVNANSAPENVIKEEV